MKLFRKNAEQHFCQIKRGGSLELKSVASLQRDDQAERRSRRQPDAETVSKNN